MAIFRRISRKKLIVLIIIYLVIIASGITVPLVFLRSSNSSVCMDPEACNPLPNMAFEALSIYAQDGDSFGKNVGSILHELNTPENLSPPEPFWAVFARCGDHHFTCNNPNGAVYIAPFNCLNSKNQTVVNLDLNPKDHNCQGILLLEPFFRYNSDGQFSRTTCAFDVRSESYSLPAVVFFGYTFYGAGNWIGEFNLPNKHGCSTGVKVHMLWVSSPPP